MALIDIVSELHLGLIIGDSKSLGFRKQAVSTKLFKLKHTGILFLQSAHLLCSGSHMFLNEHFVPDIYFDNGDSQDLSNLQEFVCGFYKGKIIADSQSRKLNAL